jgi:hypothetical protein
MNLTGTLLPTQHSMYGPVTSFAIVVFNHSLPPLDCSQGHLISTICTHAPSTLLPTQHSMYGPVTSFAISMGAFIGSFVAMGLSVQFQMH